MSPGAEACVRLNQFEEAIVFCDKGLAVSFKNSTLLYKYSVLCIVRKLSLENDEKGHFILAFHAHIEGKQICSKVISKYKCRCNFFYFKSVSAIQLSPTLTSRRLTRMIESCLN